VSTITIEIPAPPDLDVTIPDTFDEVMEGWYGKVEVTLVGRLLRKTLFIPHAKKIDITKWLIVPTNPTWVSWCSTFTCFADAVRVKGVEYPLEYGPTYLIKGDLIRIELHFSYR
jgi:hypothetical protein